MSSAAFNSFETARALESAGVGRAQAEAIAEALQRRQDYATKADVAALRTDVAALETRLMNRIYAIAIAQAGLVAAFGLLT